MAVAFVSTPASMTAVRYDRVITGWRRPEPLIRRDADFRRSVQLIT